MPIPAVLTANNWKNQGLTLRTTFEKIKKLSTGVSQALRDLATADNLPAWDVGPKHQAYVAANGAITATINAHVNNAALSTLLNNMRNALPNVKQTWEHAIDAITLNQAVATAGLYDAFHHWAQSQHVEENIEFLKAEANHMAPAALYATFVAPGAPKMLTLDDHNLVQALAQAPGHNDPASWAKVSAAVLHMISGNRFTQFKQSLKNAL